jgi:MSHA pilin protein MshA
MFAYGFTLIELVMVIVILGVLAAVALPKFLDLGSSARIASINALQGAIKTSANNIHAACAVNSGCSISARIGSVTLDGKSYGLNYGWIGAGTGINTGLIDDAIVYSGFSVSISNPYTTFKLNSAPNPNTCSVTYGNAWGTIDTLYTLTTQTSGC